MRIAAILAAVASLLVACGSTPGGDDGPGSAAPSTSAETGTAPTGAETVTVSPFEPAPKAPLSHEPKPTPSAGPAPSGGPASPPTPPSTAPPTQSPSVTTPPTGRPAAPTAQPPVGALPTDWVGRDWEVLPGVGDNVALTFDGGSSNTAAATIVRTLQDYGVTATFFVTGEFARSYPDDVRAMSNAGFPVGNHSDTHPAFSTSTNAVIRAELAAAERDISALTGVTTRPLFRFPFGDRTDLDIQVVNGEGYIPVRWTVDTLGWKGLEGGERNAQTVCDRVLSTARSGQIVLMHVGGHPQDRSTLDSDALPCIIDGLRARGYGFVNLRDVVGR